MYGISATQQSLNNNANSSGSGSGGAPQAVASSAPLPPDAISQSVPSQPLYSGQMAPKAGLSDSKMIEIGLGALGGIMLGGTLALVLGIKAGSRMKDTDYQKLQRKLDLTDNQLEKFKKHMEKYDHKCDHACSDLCGVDSRVAALEEKNGIPTPAQKKATEEKERESKTSGYSR